MSQSSETTSRPELIELGYPNGIYGAGYYVAMCGEGLGVCVSPIGDICMVQLFPWGPDKWDLAGQAVYASPIAGHARYSRFLWEKARAGEDHLLWSYPYLKCPVDTDLLTIKCLIEEGIKQCEQHLNKSR